MNAIAPRLSELIAVGRAPAGAILSKRTRPGPFFASGGIGTRRTAAALQAAAVAGAAGRGFPPKLTRPVAPWFSVAP